MGKLILQSLKKAKIMKTAIFAGSFDPFTNGHLDIAQQASKVFDKIIIGVGISGGKNPLFSPEERVEVIAEIFKDMPEVEVKAFSGLVVDFAKKCNAGTLVRGLRTESDFSYEMPMAMTNQKIAPEIQTVFFPTKSQFAYVSSSLVKELRIHGGDVTAFVPPTILQSLEAKCK